MKTLKQEIKEEAIPALVITVSSFLFAAAVNYSVEVISCYLG